MTASRAWTRTGSCGPTWALIQATLRTNYFAAQSAEEAGEADQPYLVFKLNAREVPDLPAPRPQFELFVYSPRFEGVHLRFASVARGGLRWSDRREDFRTEILGLAKAQEVKNSVIVPSGAKGGFVCKQLPDPSDREAYQGEVLSCYRMFIAAMLDVTDNLEAGHVVPPARVVRHDGDDPYLVVAADKGTATFSDTANEIATEPRILARRRVRVRRLGRLRPQEDGHYRARRVGVGPVPLPHTGRRRRQRRLLRGRRRRHVR